MRSFLGAALLVAGTASACAAVSGLNMYSGSAGDDGAATGKEDGGQSPPPGDDSTGDEPLADGEAAMEEPGDPQETGNAPDSGAPGSEAGGGDASRTCSPANCNGCCQGTVCYGGHSLNTCGVAGAACVNCTSQGACNANGTCGAPPKDGGGLAAGKCTSTDVSSCGLCSGTFVYDTCCASGTCGCQFTPFAPCSAQ